VYLTVVARSFFYLLENIFIALGNKGMWKKLIIGIYDLKHNRTKWYINQFTNNNELAFVMLSVYGLVGWLGCRD
jgi:hypothetical protein